MHRGSAPNNAPGPGRSHRRQRVNSLRFAARVRRSSERTGSDDASPAGMMSRRPRSPYEMRWQCEWTLGLRQQSSTRRRARRPRTSRPHYASWHHEKPTTWDLIVPAHSWRSWIRDLGPRLSGPFSLAPRPSFRVNEASTCSLQVVKRRWRARMADSGLRADRSTRYRPEGGSGADMVPNIQIGLIASAGMGPIAL